jgi:hypothetical protein
MDELAYHLDMEGLEGADHPGQGGSSLRDRPWVGIHFDCCGVYARIYRNPEGTAYRGACPRCRRSVTLRVGTGGTDARFFQAT